MVEHSSLSATLGRASRRPVTPLFPVLVGLIIIAATGVFAYQTESGVTNSRNWVLHTYDVRSELQTLETQIAETRAAALAYAVSGDESQFQEFHTRAESITRLIENLRTLTADNPRQQYRLGQLETASRKYLAELDSSLASIRPRGAIHSAEGDAIRNLDSQQTQQESMVHGMADEEQMLLDERLAIWRRFFVRNSLILSLSFAVALLFLVYNYRLLSREVARTREMEQAQRESVHSSRALSARILELQDAERRKVARELHDSVGQYITGLKINLEQLQIMNPNLSPAHMKLLSDTVELTDRALAEVRTISHLLHPPLLDEVGLESAARWYTDGFAKRCGLTVNLQLGEITNRLPREVELALFRVLQESLTNVHRHANAKSIDVNLTCGDGRVVLTVNDDGRGIPREVVTRFRSGLASGVGLAGMRERLAELDGVLEVESKARGSCVRAIIPTMECPPEPSSVETSTV
jgi:signal transduction histidine kinase